MQTDANWPAAVPLDSPTSEDLDVHEGEELEDLLADIAEDVLNAQDDSAQDLVFRQY